MNPKKIISTLSLSLLASTLMFATANNTFANNEAKNMGKPVMEASAMTQVMTTVHQLDPYMLTQQQEMKAIKFLNNHLAKVSSNNMFASTLDLRPVFSKKINPAISGIIVSLEGEMPNPYQSFFDKTEVKDNKAYFQDYYAKFLAYAPKANYSFAVYPQDKEAKMQHKIEISEKAKPTFLFIDKDSKVTHTKLMSDSIMEKGGLLYIAPNRSIYLNIVDIQGHTNQAPFTILLTNQSNQPQLFTDSVNEYMDLWLAYALEKAKANEAWEAEKAAHRTAEIAAAEGLSPEEISMMQKMGLDIKAMKLMKDMDMMQIKEMYKKEMMADQDMSRKDMMMADKNMSKKITMPTEMTDKASMQMKFVSYLKDMGLSMTDVENMDKAQMQDMYMHFMQTMPKTTKEEMQASANSSMMMAQKEKANCPMMPASAKMMKDSNMHVNYEQQMAKGQATNFYFPTVIKIEKYVKDVVMQDDCMGVKPLLPLFLGTTAYGPADYHNKVLIPDYNFTNFQWFADKVLADFPANSYIDNYKDMLIKEQYQVLEDYRHSLVK